MNYVIIFFLSLSFFVQAQISFFCDGGHSSVNRSIQRGCELNHIPFNWNPSNDTVYSTAIVLAGEGYVRHAIALKKQGIIKKLLVGPNVFVRSSDGGGIMGHPAIDRCIVPSDWVRVAYEEDNQALIGRTVVWPAGIDELYWQPEHAKNNESKNVLVYWKTESEFFIREIELCLRLYGWNPITIRYGHYGQHYYKQLLENAAFAVFVSVSESQGLALAESWAMNVPTLVWDPQHLVAHGRVYSVVTACPYLTDATGYRWQTIHDFEHLLQQIPAKLAVCSPRTWVLDNMTDSITIQNLMNIVYGIAPAEYSF